MTVTQFTPAIDSRPAYAPLRARPGAAILVADAAGRAALDPLAEDAALMARAQALLIAAPPLEGARETLQAADPAGALALLRPLLENARMGTQLYIAGSHGLIAQVSALALEAGMLPGAIQAEHRGTLARRMQCVHCKGITEEVTTDPFTCTHCGLTLFVRDHFSRRLGVFQGVCVDAETPGVIPPPQEIRA
ncbi:hypothetical protein GR170_08265 [Pseudooceanicola sp. GBMRC 2024]|uniref:Uncharacterized protein n=1 Tax=Pseudooceanicola albus TaxID=2692189 RepID=A0A6L7G196_9RHOB|nr:dimethylamine monooxygenase subunit DmmA family protein [Pseudooceanicola albus]MXN17825.1 hypothetical protein [Pseudooceanicola albus]